ncbi:MAG: CDP-diacylglycerol--serine O-phosphatidyltransferase [Candidatus Kapaibacterium sp.]|jgi:CDP-diacylglycerol--serine O-phosphatidyltransferase
MIKVTRSVIPSLFTIMNLFSGFIAIKAAMVDSDFVTAGWFILLGAIFDVFDGFMARLTHSASEFGVELDSLADVVTFGVAPSAMLYKLFFFRFGGLGLLVAALPAMCGAIRLARFNVQLVGFDKDYFRGLPIPAAALLIISYAIFYHLHPDPKLASATYDGAMFVVAISASLLMVSTIKYDTMPKPSLRALKAHPIKYAIYIAGVVLTILSKGSAIFPLFVLFVMHGVFRSLWDRSRRLLTERRALAIFDQEAFDDEEKDTFGI